MKKILPILSKEEAKNFLSDRIWRLNHLYKIKTKDRQLKTLKLNRAQMEYLANESLRDIILKARQLGFSTLKLIELLDFVLFGKNTNAAVIAHQREKVQVLFEIVRLAYEHFPDLGPEFPKPKASYDNRNELYFPELNSKIYVATDTRGETVHNLHVSELAYIKRADEKMLGILESVPKDGIISFESTGNGISGYFYQVWEDSKNEFRKHFFSWIFDSEYVEITSKSLDQLIAEYQSLQLQYGLMPEIWQRLHLTKEQLAWYISKVRRHKEKVMQEYPSNPIEAFVASGRNVFSISDLQKHLVKDPIDRKYQDLFIWEYPSPQFRYVIGCDPSEGIGEDNSTIEVLNIYTGEQVAELATNNIPPDELAGYLIDIGKYYNKAYIVLEVNNHGISVRDHLKKKYANLYRREVFDKISNRYIDAIGWKTTGITKPLLVDALEEATRNADIMIHSEKALSEMKTFVRTEEENKRGFGAEGSNKDDRVIALGLALQGIRQLPKMKAPKTLAQKKLDEFIQKQQLSRLFPSQQVIHSHQQQRYKIRRY